MAPEPKFGNNELTVPCFASRHTLKTWKRSLDSCGRNMHAESDQIIWPLWPNCQLFAKRSFEVSLFIFHLCRFKKGKNYITSKFIQFFSHTSYMMMYITNIKLLVTLEKHELWGCIEKDHAKYTYYKGKSTCHAFFNHLRNWKTQEEDLTFLCLKIQIFQILKKLQSFIYLGEHSNFSSYHFSTSWAFSTILVLNFA